MNFINLEGYKKKYGIFHKKGQGYAERRRDRDRETHILTEYFQQTNLILRTNKRDII